MLTPIESYVEARAGAGSHRVARRRGRRTTGERPARAAARTAHRAMLIADAATRASAVRAAVWLVHAAPPPARRTPCGTLAN